MRGSPKNAISGGICNCWARLLDEGNLEVPSIIIAGMVVSATSSLVTLLSVSVSVLFAFFFPRLSSMVPSLVGAFLVRFVAYNLHVHPQISQSPQLDSFHVISNLPIIVPPGWMNWELDWSYSCNSVYKTFGLRIRAKVNQHVQELAYSSAVEQSPSIHSTTTV